MDRPLHQRRAKDSVRKFSNVVWVTNSKGRCILIINQTEWSARSTFLHRKVLMEAKPLAGRHILLVEDEMMILLMMEEMLIDLGEATLLPQPRLAMPSLRSMDTLSMPPCWM
jgi:hypothetical protein